LAVGPGRHAVPGREPRRRGPIAVAEGARRTAAAFSGRSGRLVGTRSPRY